MVNYMSVICKVWYNTCEIWGDLMHELLVPAGDMASLRAAVFNGCDAVYLACKNFGARKYATNFSNEEIIEAVKLCHLYGVKIYIAMNTLVKENEVDDFLKQAYFLHEIGVDALIVQDFGMICLLREKYPELEIHASTQANTSSYETCLMFKKLGVKRVVFSRELSIEEIDNIDVDIEKEAFIHGALCISYSGCCLMSSMLGSRSGNRGECAGTCRMPFTLKKDDRIISDKKYLLSTKELNTSSQIKRLLESSIYSFKIEGRMKSPLYVGFITRFYRKLIDGEEFDLEEENRQLRTIFNREFTVGRLFSANDLELMNVKSPNHIGLEIGEVLEVNSKKIKIKLTNNSTLNQYDAIRFLNSKKGMVCNFLYDDKMLLTNSANGICYVDNKVGLDKIDKVSKTQDYKLSLEFINEIPRKVKINFFVKAKLGEKLLIIINDGEYKFEYEGCLVTLAKNAPVSKAAIKEKLDKLGTSPFKLNKIEFLVDEDIFIPIKELNIARQWLVDKLIDARENSKGIVVSNDVCLEKRDNLIDNKVKISSLVYTEEQLCKCLELGVKRIYVVDDKLYDNYKDYDEVYFVVDRNLLNIKECLKERNLVSEYFNYSDYKSLLIGNYSLNVTNSYTAYYLNKILGLDVIPLSVELDYLEITELLDNYEKKFGYLNFEILGYGLVQNMVIKGNILGLESNNYEYNLIDTRERKFPVYFNGNRTYIFNYCCRDFKIKRNNVTIRLDFFLENATQITEIVKKYDY